MTFKVNWLQSRILLNCEFEVCPHDNSSPIQTGITKFGAEVQNALLEIPILYSEVITTTVNRIQPLEWMIIAMTT